jgi:hypothetical protein
MKESVFDYSFLIPCALYHKSRGPVRKCIYLPLAQNFKRRKNPFPLGEPWFFLLQSKLQKRTIYIFGSSFLSSLPTRKGECTYFKEVDTFLADGAVVLRPIVGQELEWRAGAESSLEL